MHRNAGIVKEDVFARQPLDNRIALELQTNPLHCSTPFRTIPLGCSRCGEDNPRSLCTGCVNAQFIPSRDSARRMQNDDMARVTSFGVQHLLYLQRTLVQVASEYGRVLAACEPKFQVRAPRSLQPSWI